MKIQFHIKDPDGIHDIYRYFKRTSGAKAAEEWANKYTEHGDYMTIELDFKQHTFKLIPN